MTKLVMIILTLGHLYYCRKLNSNYLSSGNKQHTMINFVMELVLFDLQNVFKEKE